MILAVPGSAGQSLAAPDIINIVYDGQCALSVPSLCPRLTLKSENSVKLIKNGLVRELNLIKMALVDKNIYHREYLIL